MRLCPSPRLILDNLWRPVARQSAASRPCASVATTIVATRAWNMRLTSSIPASDDVDVESDEQSSPIAHDMHAFEEWAPQPSSPLRQFSTLARAKHRNHAVAKVLRIAADVIDPAVRDRRPRGE